VNTCTLTVSTVKSCIVLRASHPNWLLCVATVAFITFFPLSSTCYHVLSSSTHFFISFRLFDFISRSVITYLIFFNPGAFSSCALRGFNRRGLEIADGAGRVLSRHKIWQPLDLSAATPIFVTLVFLRLIHISSPHPDVLMC
jgi:hypothetical protein